MAEERKAVLVVDDDVELVKMVEILLEGAGYRVITAAEGQEALDKVAKGMPEVILLDMKMPGMDGWEFAREFHARHDNLAPIIVFTAAEDARKRAQEIGAESYLGKPFDISDLISIVERHVGRTP
ncbi:MAG: response regulator [Chloroflexi bacterium]|nr:response regulator [Chloroflexota bacterium]MDA8188162.1 response regulator [Dehalococcoidales bacterium]